jgi:hypothetical protein
MSAIRTRRLPFLTLAAALFSLATVACGGGDDSSTGPTPSSEATLSVTNNSNGTALFIRRRACGTSSWSSDMLGSTVLSHGEHMSWEVSPGCYDLRLTPGETGLDYLYYTNLQLDAGETEAIVIATWPAE